MQTTVCVFFVLMVFLGPFSQSYMVGLMCDCLISRLFVLKSVLAVCNSL